MVRKSSLAWFSLCRSWSCGLLFLDSGSGEEDTDDATDQESFELSELNDTSITPLGLPGMEPNLRLLDWLPWTSTANSITSLLQCSTLSCLHNHHDLGNAIEVPHYEENSHWFTKIQLIVKRKLKTLTLSIPSMSKMCFRYSTPRQGSIFLTTWSIVALAIIEGRYSINLKSGYKRNINNKALH